jgi:LPXTG-motif cell wall-anchored protein
MSPSEAQRLIQASGLTPQQVADVAVAGVTVSAPQANALAGTLGGGLTPEVVMGMSPSDIQDLADVAGVSTEVAGIMVANDDQMPEVAGVQALPSQLPNTGDFGTAPIAAGLTLLGSLGFALRRFGRRAA